MNTNAHSTIGSLQASSASPKPQAILDCHAERLSDALARLHLLTLDLEGHAERLFGASDNIGEMKAGVLDNPYGPGAVTRMDALLNNLHDQISNLQNAVASNCRMA